jgi:hypothetical protein
MTCSAGIRAYQLTTSCFEEGSKSQRDNAKCFRKNWPAYRWSFFLSVAPLEIQFRRLSANNFPFSFAARRRKKKLSEAEARDVSEFFSPFDGKTFHFTFFASHQASSPEKADGQITQIEIEKLSPCLSPSDEILKRR